MNLQRIKIGLLAVAGLALTGRGHYFIATQQAEYPIDGYVFYALGALCGLWLGRLLSRTPDALWTALRDALRVAFQVVGDALPLRIEGAVSWGKSSTDDLFALAAQV